MSMTAKTLIRFLSDIVDLKDHAGMIYLVNCNEWDMIQNLSNGDIYYKYINGDWFSLDPESDNYYKNSYLYKKYVYNILFNDYFSAGE